MATVVLTTDCLVKFETNGGSEIEPVVAIYGEPDQAKDFDCIICGRENTPIPGIPLCGLCLLILLLILLVLILIGCVIRNGKKKTADKGNVKNE